MKLILSLLILSSSSFLFSQTGGGLAGTQGGSSSGVTSVSMVMPSTLFSGCNVTITSTGTFTCAYATSQTANRILLSNASGTVGFASLTLAMLPASIPLTGLATQAADTTVMNASGSTAAPTAIAINDCHGATNALIYNTTTHAYGCNTISGGGSSNIPIQNVPMYAKSFWANLSDFTVVGTTPTITNGMISWSQSSGANIDAQKLVLTAVAPNSDDSTDFETDTIVGTTGNGIGIGRLSTNTWTASSISAQIYTTGTPFQVLFYQASSSTLPSALFTFSASATYCTGSNYNISAGDNLRVILSQRHSSYSILIYDTVPGAGTYSCQFTITNSFTTYPSINFHLSNTSQWVLYNLGGVYTTTSLRLTSRQWSYPNVLVLGDSKSAGYDALDPQYRYGNLLSAIGPVDIVAGESDRIEEVTAAIPYITALHPTNIILNIGRNNLAQGTLVATVFTAYQTLVTALGTALPSTTITHLLPIPEGSVSQTAFSALIAAAYTGHTIDVAGSPYNFTATGTVYVDAGGVHPTPIGHSTIAGAILGSALITNVSNPIRTYPAVWPFRP